jgi:hypothetical protein
MKGQLSTPLFLGMMFIKKYGSIATSVRQSILLFTMAGCMFDWSRWFAAAKYNHRGTKDEQPSGLFVFVKMMTTACLLIMSSTYLFYFAQYNSFNVHQMFMSVYYAEMKILGTTSDFSVLSLGTYETVFVMCIGYICGTLIGYVEGQTALRPPAQVSFFANAKGYGLMIFLVMSFVFTNSAEVKDIQYLNVAYTGIFVIIALAMTDLYKTSQISALSLASSRKCANIVSLSSKYRNSLALETKYVSEEKSEYRLFGLEIDEGRPSLSAIPIDSPEVDEEFISSFDLEQRNGKWITKTQYETSQQDKFCYGGKYYVFKRFLSYSDNPKPCSTNSRQLRPCSSTAPNPGAPLVVANESPSVSFGDSKDEVG